MDIVKKFALPSFVNLRVHNFCDLIFDVAFNFDQRRRRLYLIGNCIGRGWFKHRDMENWVDRAESVGKAESE